MPVRQYIACTAELALRTVRIIGTLEYEVQLVNAPQIFLYVSLCPKVNFFDKDS